MRNCAIIHPLHLELETAGDKEGGVFVMILRVINLFAKE
jgi:hypothetical protein